MVLQRFVTGGLSSLAAGFAMAVMAVVVLVIG
jgi:hypothetical protein